MRLAEALVMRIANIMLLLVTLATNSNSQPAESLDSSARVVVPIAVSSLSQDQGGGELI
jgi:hypothetical protein